MTLVRLTFSHILLLHVCILLLLMYCFWFLPSLTESQKLFPDVFLASVSSLQLHGKQVIIMAFLYRKAYEVYF